MPAYQYQVHVLTHTAIKLQPAWLMVQAISGANTLSETLLDTQLTAH
jgi:hypothetical protein